MEGARGAILGASGMLGREVAALFPDFQRWGRSEIDLTAADFELPRGEVDWIANCAAYTAVDRAESEPELAQRVNAAGPLRLAKLASQRGARLIHISTDFVFDGRADRPYREEDATDPIGVYGGTKREGEIGVLSASDEHVVLRTAWLFGDAKCFPRTMVRLWSEDRPLRVVNDQIGSPTWTRDVAQVIGHVIGKNPPGGIYHVAGKKAMSWYEFALRTLEIWRDRVGSDRPIEVTPILTRDFPTPARRPHYSALDISRALNLGFRPTHIDDALTAWADRLIDSSEPL